MDSTDSTLWRFLFGFYQLEEAIAIATSQGVPLDPPAVEQLRVKIERAISHVRTPPRGGVTTPSVSEIPTGFRDHLAKLEGESTFIELTTGMRGWAWKQVDLASLRTFQPSVNWDYVQKLKARAPAPNDPGATLRFCLPAAGSGTPQRVAVTFNPTVNTYSIVTEHLDFRIVGQVQGEDPATKRKFFGFATGFGLPTLSVAHYRDMYLLKNGYHRAVALLASGHVKVPALVVETDSFQMTGAAGAGFFTIDILSSARPPLLSDFLSDAAVDISRPKMRTVLTIHGEGQPLAL
jgi:hypothetical protein